jgi:hypothetical protein
VRSNHAFRCRRGERLFPNLAFETNAAPTTRRNDARPFDKNRPFNFLAIFFEYTRCCSRLTIKAAIHIITAMPWPRAEAQLNKIGERIMKKSLITIACALVAPIAFAQTSTTTTEQTTTAPAAATTTETTTYETGTVTTYTPGKTIVVRSERSGPVTFALGTASRVIDATGKIVTAPLRAGQKVRVYYTGTGDTRVVERVQVED